MIKSENRRVRFLAIFISATILFAGLSLTGCSTVGVDKPSGGVGQQQNQQTPDKTSTMVETTLDLVEQGKALKVDFSLKNSSDKELDLLFGSGHQYDIIVTNSKGREVYNWAVDKAFTEALIEKKLAPGQQLSYSEEWEYTDNAGKPLPHGKYSVKVDIKANVKNEEVKAEDLSATKEIEIK